jgi:hypothetical protein
MMILFQTHGVWSHALPYSRRKRCDFFFLKLNIWLFNYLFL